MRGHSVIFGVGIGVPPCEIKLLVPAVLYVYLTLLWGWAVQTLIVMRTKLNWLLIMAVISGAFLSSCEKEPVIGPEGPKGVTGSTGINGTDGTNGTNGAGGTNGANGVTGPTGNANVKSSVFPILVGDWVETGTPGQPLYGYKASLYYNQITQDIVDNGLVIPYMASSNSGPWISLPVTATIGTYQKYIQYSYSLNSVEIDIIDSDLYTAKPIGTIYIKVVAISSNGKKRLEREKL